MSSDHACSIGGARFRQVARRGRRGPWRKGRLGREGRMPSLAWNKSRNTLVVLPILDSSRGLWSEGLALVRAEGARHRQTPVHGAPCGACEGKMPSLQRGTRSDAGPVPCSLWVGDPASSAGWKLQRPHRQVRQTASAARRFLRGAGASFRGPQGRPPMPSLRRPAHSEAKANRSNSSLAWWRMSVKNVGGDARLVGDGGGSFFWALSRSCATLALNRRSIERGAASGRRLGARR